MKKSAAEAHRMLLNTYGEAAISEKTCREWFQRFKNGDFDVEDRYSGGREKIFERLKSPGIFQCMASLENEHDSFREVHLSLVYVWSFMTFCSFVYKLQSLSGTTFAFVLYHHDNAPSHMKTG